MADERFPNPITTAAQADALIDLIREVERMPCATCGGSGRVSGPGWFPPCPYCGAVREALRVLTASFNG